MLNIAVLVSGGGTNLQALIDNMDKINGKIVTVVSNKEGVFALDRAKKAGISSITIKSKDNPDFEEQLAEHLLQNKVDIIVLAGFLAILKGEVLKHYKNKIINVHPSLIPSFCGKGYYGLKVHKAALDYGVKVSGATVHLVNDVVDGGKILLQKAVCVQEGDTPEILQQRIMQEAEQVILPKALQMICSGEINI